MMTVDERGERSRGSDGGDTSISDTFKAPQTSCGSLR